MILTFLSVCYTNTRIISTQYVQLYYNLCVNYVSMHSQLWMHDEIFHFDIFKKIMEILKYFKTPSLKYVMNFFNFYYKVT